MSAFVCVCVGGEFKRWKQWQIRRCKRCENSQDFSVARRREGEIVNPRQKL